MRTFNDYVLSIFSQNKGNCNTFNNATLLEKISEDIQWAWENWDFDWEDYSDTTKVAERPDLYTDEFATEWIQNEPFDTLQELYIEQHGNELDYFLIEKFLTKII